MVIKFQNVDFICTFWDILSTAYTRRMVNVKGALFGTNYKRMLLTHSLTDHPIHEISHTGVVPIPLLLTIRKVYTDILKDVSKRVMADW